MAGLQATQAGLLGLIQGAVANVGHAVEIGLGWPPVNRLQGVARGTNVIAIYNRRLGRDRTRWTKSELYENVTAASLTATASGNAISASSPGTVTIGGTPALGDAVAVVLINQVAQTSAGQVAIASTGATATSMASALAAAINADATLSTWVSATANGDQVTISLLPSAAPLQFAVNTGNGGTRTSEVGRREVEFQVSIWTETAEIRDAFADPIDQAIAAAEIDFGYELSDGTNIRLMYRGNFDIEDATLQDAYRRDFLLSVEYPVTVEDVLTSVLIPSLSVAQL